MRFRRILERVALIDLDADATGGNVAEQLACQRRLFRGIGDVVGECRPG